jgi:hypothetical protein
MREASYGARAMATQLAADGRSLATILAQVEARYGPADRLAIERLAIDRLASQTLRERIHQHRAAS